MPDATPSLRRALRLGSVVLFGLAYMTPLIVLGTFGIVSELTSGATPSAYLLALAAMLFTAYSYGTMSRAHPVAGSAYTYVRRTIDSRVGFLVGWAVLLDYFFLPMVIWLIGATYLQAQFPSVPFSIWILAFIAATTCLNVLGIKVANKANFLLMAFQLLVVAIFVVLSLRHLVATGGSWFSATPFINGATTWGGVSAGAALAAYSFLGFDAVTTLTEETVDPRRTMPRAILLIALIGGGIFVLVAYTTQLVHPGNFAEPDSAAFQIATTIAGDVFAAVFLAGLVVAQFASGLAAQASAARLLFAMGRDGVLPRKVFGYLHTRFGTPVFNTVLTGAIGLVALMLDVSTSTSFINFGAFVAFTAVNVSVLALFLRERAAGRRPRILPYVVVPVIGAAIDIWLLVNLDSAALVLGSIWLVVGIVYLAYLTRLFRTPPPTMDVAEQVEPASR
ncbi:APC family permease [Saccharopolyspora sp. K220]|uniref:APC family permease n=1 Tax=Saccharopolyspora soli TaxID=2926618 RepID=UPI001F58F0BA|nr:APC family permease [Saccharopolyspora soli]MCI2423717.1 APC family permease [Saccharopolyspora soli]